MRWLLLLCALLGCEAQQDPSSDVSEQGLLARIRMRIAENLDRLPNYTCAEQVKRSARMLPSLRWKSIDTVRLEVALVNGNELYGWPGASRIEESELSSLVSGTIGNGDFALVARGIFQSRNTVFHDRGEVTLHEQAALRYDYAVPLQASGYHLKSAGNEAVVQYHGSFWVEPETLDMMRLEVVADNIPEYLGLAASTKVLDYRHVRFGSSDFVLPSAATLDMVDLSGQENLNQSRFHACRQYSGETKLSFDAVAEQLAPAQLESVRELDLPDDFEANVSLMAPLDSSLAAVGDAVQVRLTRALRMGRKTVVPRSAVLNARIIEMHLAGSVYHVSFAFESLQYENSHADLSARRNIISMPIKIGSSGLHTLRGYNSTRLRTSGGLVIESEHLHLARGFTFRLHSKLIESHK